MPPLRRPLPGSFLDRFDASEMERLFWYLDRVACKPGDVLLTQGKVEGALLIAMRGAFEIITDGRPVGTVRAGSVLGELEFFETVPCASSVVAREEGEVLRMTRARFSEVRRRDGALACALAMEVGRALSELYREERAFYGQ